MQDRARPSPNSELTAREKQVLALVTALASNRAIATTLGCSVKTVEFHVSNILRKTNTTSRLELVVKLLGEGRVANAAGRKPTFE
jgi:DNA-binding CsgD family transcriptional regulator